MKEALENEQHLLHDMVLRAAPQCSFNLVSWPLPRAVIFSEQASDFTVFVSHIVCVSCVHVSWGACPASVAVSCTILDIRPLTVQEHDRDGFKRELDKANADCFALGFVSAIFTHA